MAATHPIDDEFLDECTWGCDVGDCYDESDDDATPPIASPAPPSPPAPAVERPFARVMADEALMSTILAYLSDMSPSDSEYASGAALPRWRLISNTANAARVCRRWREIMDRMSDGGSMGEWFRRGCAYQCLRQLRRRRLREWEATTPRVVHQPYVQDFRPIGPLQPAWFPVPGLRRFAYGPATAECGVPDDLFRCIWFAVAYYHLYRDLISWTAVPLIMLAFGPTRETSDRWLQRHREDGPLFRVAYLDRLFAHPFATTPLFWAAVAQVLVTSSQSRDAFYHPNWAMEIPKPLRRGDLAAYVLGASLMREGREGKKRRALTFGSAPARLARTPETDDVLVRRLFNSSVALEAIETVLQGVELRTLFRRTRARAQATNMHPVPNTPTLIDRAWSARPDNERSSLIDRMVAIYYRVYRQDELSYRIRALCCDWLDALIDFPGLPVYSIRRILADISPTPACQRVLLRLMHAAQSTAPTCGESTTLWEVIDSSTFRSNPRVVEEAPEVIGAWLRASAMYDQAHPPIGHVIGAVERTIADKRYLHFLLDAFLERDCPLAAEQVLRVFGVLEVSTPV